jgi:hypothetical protein
MHFVVKRVFRPVSYEGGWRWGTMTLVMVAELEVMALQVVLGVMRVI